ncbi:HIT-like domain-containing protein [Echria macrotheca]|uniref:Aprataxin-like protein n=1 Tax=Echria macrotheca TaxID=438768 RepID=A0AAJ0B8F6_9PEZI|nr:HIT-like domain-containing protein [Echria macrotheca]
MAEEAEDAQDFVEGNASSDPASAKTRNAFTELMRPKPKAPKTEGTDPTPRSALKKLVGWKGALLEPIEHPERFPSEVVRVTLNTVLLRDKFPKATVHLLLLPRSRDHYDLHPHEAFADPAFLAMIKEEAASAADLAAAELGRLLSPFSASSKARNDAMDAGEVSFAELPPGRDYRSEIRVGIHAHPSMAHLHVHIISRDMHSDKVKHRKHYNSFNTPFFIPVEDYPLLKDDERLRTSFQNANLGRDLVCWRCGRDFGKHFAQLKEHLEEEFEVWKAL